MKKINLSIKNIEISKPGNTKKLINPNREWRIILVIIFFIIIGTIFYDIYTYMQISSGEMYISVKKEELIIENLKENQLKKVVNSFEQKIEISSSSKLENLPDPSI